MKFGELMVEENDDPNTSPENDSDDLDFLKNLKKSDKVNVCTMTSFGNESKEIVTGIKVKYDEDSGEPYNVIQIGKDWLFDSRTGNAITSPTMYYLSR
jgi:hypothetical protein